MFFDLSVPVPEPATRPQIQKRQLKKDKAKQSISQDQNVAFSASQIANIESRVDLLIRLGYSVLAFNQIVQSRVDIKTHVNVLDPLLKQLKRRPGVIYLKRLTLMLDEESEKGTGLSAANASLFTSYDILGSYPTTQTSFANACLTHSQPSPMTTHIISIPLTAPRLPFRMKHTLVRTAIKNGAVFEINYSGALQGEDDRRNWWAAARELTRVTKGLGMIVSGGADAEPNLRAPRDVGNLIALLGLAQNLAHNAATTTPKSLILRAQTRRTYRAIFSEPTLIMPTNQSISTTDTRQLTDDLANVTVSGATEHSQTPLMTGDVFPSLHPMNNKSPSSSITQVKGTKRRFDALEDEEARSAIKDETEAMTQEKRRKKKGKAKMKIQDAERQLHQSDS